MKKEIVTTLDKDLFSSYIWSKKSKIKYGGSSRVRFQVVKTQDGNVHIQYRKFYTRGGSGSWSGSEMTLTKKAVTELKKLL